ncbi:hypothetical protein POSPLADRAFT_1106265, partial [Postia placenta MAD-698-R-SB12]
GNIAADFEVAFQLAVEETRRQSLFEQDRALAVRLSIIDDDDVVFPNAQTTVNNGHQIDGHDNTHGTNVSASLSGQRQGSVATRRRDTGHICVICTDPIYNDEVRAPCGDYYDRECIVALFEAAVRDESLFPPRCCRQHIPLTLVHRFLSAALVKLFHEKTKEFGTLKRIYCANSSCSRFLGAQVEGAFSRWLWPTYKCPAPRCGTSTCT